MKFLFPIILMVISLPVFAQSPIGSWKTIDDDTGQASSHVEIYQQGGKLFGKVTKLLQEDPNTVCDQCSGSNKNKPVVGLVIIEDLKQEGNSWASGTILDPKDGKEYNCEIWLEGGNLKVRGKHWTGLYRTQTWYRI
ncbi:MAG: DUF2147 domain-containing protein [Bacteroidota bacterium]